MSDNFNSASSTAPVLGSRQTDAVVGVFITFFFNCIGIFFAFWLFAHRGILNSIFIAILYFAAFGISTFLCALLVGYVLLPVVWLVSLVHTYRAIMHQ